MTAEQGLFYSLSVALGAIGTAKSCVEQMIINGQDVPTQLIALNLIEMEEAMNELSYIADIGDNDENDFYAGNN